MPQKKSLRAFSSPMADRHTGSYPVTDELLDLTGFGKAAGGWRENKYLAIQAHLESPAGAWDQGHLPYLRAEGQQDLLGQPGRAQHEAALRAVLDLDPGSPSDRPVC